MSINAVLSWQYIIYKLYLITCFTFPPPVLRCHQLKFLKQKHTGGKSRAWIRKKIELGGKYCQHQHVCIVVELVEPSYFFFPDWQCQRFPLAAPKPIYGTIIRNFYSAFQCTVSCLTSLTCLTPLVLYPYGQFSKCLHWCQPTMIKALHSSAFFLWCHLIIWARLGTHISQDTWEAVCRMRWKVLYLAK